MSDALGTQIAELKAKIEAQAHQQRRLHGYIAKYAAFMKAVHAAIQPSMLNPQKAIQDALDEMGNAKRPDAPALASVPELEDKHAMVLYFCNDKDRDEFSAMLIEEAKRMGWQEVRTEKI